MNQEEKEDTLENLREQRDDALSTLNAWFDQRPLSHKAIDQAVLNAAKGYLRTCQSGGMTRKQANLVQGVLYAMAEHGVFADIYTRIIMEKKTP